MTLKVGDKVRLSGPHYYSEAEVGSGPVYHEAPNGVGSEGAVIAPVPFHGPAQHVRVEWTDGTRSVIAPSSLEKIEEEPPRPLGLRAGDKVVNLKTGREGLVLKGPISGDLKVYDQKPPIKDAVPAAALEEYEHWHPGTYDVWRRVAEKKKAQPW